MIVVERAGATKNQNALWLCQCDCGGTIAARATGLRRGDTISCGCSSKSMALNARKVMIEEQTIDGVQVPLLTKKVRSDSRTGHKGVARRIRKGKEYYEVNITLKGKRYHVGTFADINDAIKARRDAEIKYHQPYIRALEDQKSEK
ncbi:RNA-binding protein [Brevibacillus composti]|uniref:AP2 domain-containing protein n=1 Tax=Brevibacillus composti TaxID=2796470 RepID=A0A7T5JP93_9BACL|nr:hypothetical protein [Brevibacillus composti]QQE75238.1 hypothetical protein JD108_04720 [Brevibacillus composti]